MNVLSFFREPRLSVLEKDSNFLFNCPPINVVLGHEKGVVLTNSYYEPSVVLIPKAKKDGSTLIYHFLTKFRKLGRAKKFQKPRTNIVVDEEILDTFL